MKTALDVFAAARGSGAFLYILFTRGKDGQICARLSSKLEFQVGETPQGGVSYRVENGWTEELLNDGTPAKPMEWLDGFRVLALMPVPPDIENLIYPVKPKNQGEANRD